MRYQKKCAPFELNLLLWWGLVSKTRCAAKSKGYCPSMKKEEILEKGSPVFFRFVEKTIIYLV